MAKNMFELGDHEVVWYDDVGYQITWVDEYGVDALPLFVPRRGFGNDTASNFQRTEEVYGEKKASIFIIEYLITQQERRLLGLQKELTRLKDLPDDE